MATRKNLRLKNFSYNGFGPYFITICTYNRQKLFGRIHDNEFIYYNEDLKFLFENTYKELEDEFSGIRFDIYCTMPDHVHFIVSNDTEGQVHLNDIIKKFKASISQGYNNLVRQNKIPAYKDKLWQKNYYDHIVRNEKQMEDCYNYVENNPRAASFKVLLAKWNREAEIEKRRLKEREQKRKAEEGKNK